MTQPDFSSRVGTFVASGALLFLPVLVLSGIVLLGAMLSTKVADRLAAGPEPQTSARWQSAQIETGVLSAVSLAIGAVIVVAGLIGVSAPHSDVPAEQLRSAAIGSLACGSATVLLAVAGLAVWWSEAAARRSAAARRLSAMASDRFDAPSSTTGQR
ncbi:heme/copper-type cytochrome/quinol oxidase subunit 3 [Flexivirga oryzae]|uniref:Heme/copper-type cytochrome/quinol oxidase subunit 3 n=1 Tax=Flexivirga oryzae TaxID=1794944 RepID=A0A839NAN3_9MICO|nr:heme/copper-type cytochrome/quinol oxidase subunit 3 [Flexivirga oryzae]